MSGPRRANHAFASRQANAWFALREPLISLLYATARVAPTRKQDTAYVNGGLGKTWEQVGFEFAGVGHDGLVGEDVVLVAKELFALLW